MSQSTFGFQSKGPWEGYGHYIHNSMCLGRPMILRFSDYQGKMAEPLLIRDKTYIEMDDPDLVSKIREFSKPDYYMGMYETCVKKFNEVVNFDREWEENLRPFFLNLKKFHVMPS